MESEYEASNSIEGGFEELGEPYLSLWKHELEEDQEASRFI